MDRRQFIGAAAAASLAPASGASARAAVPAAPQPRPVREVRLAGMGLAELREKYRRELFEEYLPFFDRHAVDHDNGGWMCSLDHDGTRVDTNKYHWFQGRGVWLMSYLYNHFEKEERYLDVARKTADFMLKHYPQKDDWWATDVAQDGTVITPFANDPFGQYFAIEGLQEYAWAAQDERFRDMALTMLKDIVRRVHDPSFALFGHPARLQGANTYMVELQTATQMLRRWDDPEIARIAETAVDVLMNKFWNPEIGLFNELLNPDLSRNQDEARKAVLGHGVEFMWIVMEEAERVKDQQLFDAAASRMLNQLNVAWDHIYGGLINAVNVDQGGFDWPVIRPAGSQMEFHGVGEYNYMKSLWSVAEAMVGLMLAFEHSRPAWSTRFYGMCQRVIDEKFSLRKYGHPLHILYADRKITFAPRASRKGNYHYPRMLAYNIQALDRIIARRGRTSGGVA